MPTTLAIHNAVNEKGWEMVKEWERLHGGGAGGGNGGDGASAPPPPPPKLLRFSGRPQDTSPKAWIKSNLLGYHPPFDRFVPIVVDGVVSFVWAGGGKVVNFVFGTL